LLAAAILLITAVSAGCGPIDDNLPTIVSMSITPNSIPRANGGMTDQFFEITIVTANFSSPLSENVRVFIQENNEEAVAGEITINGDTIVLKRIAQSWFQGLEPATYNIGATVNSEGEAEQATQRNLATVTVTP
jgi:hypothetical protein